MKKLILLIAAFTIGTVTNVTAAEFSDVPSSHWAHDTISELADKGIINGIEEGVYAPEGTLTRAQFIKLLVCASDDYDNSTTYTAVYNDTAADAWYTPYVTCGVYSNIIERDTDYFYPDTAITRGEAAVWMINGMGVSSEANCKFNDVTDAEQKKAVAIASAYGLINGYEDGTFKPNNTLTRAEAAALISRMMNKTASFKALREDSANEVVFKEGVKYAQTGSSNKVGKVDNDKKTITFTNADETVKNLQKGDILYMPESGSLPDGLIAKVTDIKLSGDTVTITCAMPELEEFVESIDISTIVSASPEHFKSASGGVVSAGKTGLNAPYKRFNAKTESDFETDIDGYTDGDFKGGKLKWVASGTATEKGTIHYETDNFATKDGAYASLDMKLDVLVDVRFSGENGNTTSVFAHANAQTDTTVVFGYSKSASTEQILKLPECEIPVAGPVKVGVTLYAVMRADGEFTVEATANLSTDTGMLYSDGTFETWNDPIITTSAKADAEGSLEMGPGVEAEVKVDCGSDFFLGDIGLVEIGAEVGNGINGYVDVEAEAEVSMDGASASASWLKPDENGVIHDCYACFYGDIYIYSQFSAGLGDELNAVVKKYFDTEATLKSPKYTAVVTPWHFSIGGTQWSGPEFKLAACEHKIVRVSGKVKDKITNEAVSGASVTIGDKTYTSDSDGYYEAYLTSGSHGVAAKAEDYYDYWRVMLVPSDKAMTFDIVMDPDPFMAAMKSYAKFLGNMGDKIDWKFNLIYLDNNDIPELVVHRKHSGRIEQAYIYTYTDDEVKQIKWSDSEYATNGFGAYGTFGYKEKQGLVSSGNGGRMGQFVSVRYLIEGTTATKIISGIETDTGTYSIDGTSVSKSYYEQVFSYEGYTTVDPSTSYDITQSNMEKVLGI